MAPAPLLQGTTFDVTLSSRSLLPYRSGVRFSLCYERLRLTALVGTHALLPPCGGGLLVCALPTRGHRFCQHADDDVCEQRAEWLHTCMVTLPGRQVISNNAQELYLNKLSVKEKTCIHQVNTDDGGITFCQFTSQLITRQRLPPIVLDRPKYHARWLHYKCMVACRNGMHAHAGSNSSININNSWIIVQCLCPGVAETMDT